MAGAAALVLAALAGMTSLALVRDREMTSATRVTTDSSLEPSPSPDRIDAYPILEGPGDLAATVRGGYANRVGDQGWGGTVGREHGIGPPTSIVGVQVFPPGVRPFPEAEPGPRADVTEMRFDDGITTLIRVADGVPIVVTGDDPDLLYEVVGLVRPNSSSPRRDGYRFAGPLPAGLSELEPPHHVVPMLVPTLTTDDGRLDVEVGDGPVLAALAGAGVTDLVAVSVNGRPGYRAATGRSIVALALSSDETLVMSSNEMSIGELMAVAARVSFTDQATWERRYGVDPPAAPIPPSVPSLTPPD